MTIEGYQFDRAKVTAKADATLYDSLAGDQSHILKGFGDEMSVTSTGLNLTVGTGLALIQGRMVRITEPEAISIPANVSGYLSITIDLTKENESTGTPGNYDYVVTNNQVEVEFVTNIISGDLNNDEMINNFILGTITSTTSAVTFVQEKTSLIDVFSKPANVKVWQPNIEYESGDLITFGTMGTLETGKLDNPMFKALKTHKSTDSFPSNVDGIWQLINVDAYSKKFVVKTFAVDFYFNRVGNMVNVYTPASKYDIGDRYDIMGAENIPLMKPEWLSGISAISIEQSSGGTFTGILSLQGDGHIIARGNNTKGTFYVGHYLVTNPAVWDAGVPDNGETE
ncbi:hypothetical protein H9L19_06860 [Weissella diestrammenae]|uniref:Uncharacterized protein n=1 Tax=Weissella diestrammenae TaxID=1162633 RepID=A0A7G9T4R3_9LACO|nr:hypothetical protein [Weissella diestrammenae]MCM0582799.1 hypothetical protein [Weissella diestrammenae]QNN75088.1 hypothetical protein H9L19_06860 [Weissella diestrammenae]